MKGGRKVRAPGPSDLMKALQNMSSDQRINAYIELNNAPPPTNPDDLKQLNVFNTEMNHKFADDVAAAENRMQYMNDQFYQPAWQHTTDYDLGIPFTGGKTRRNRKRRGRRSLRRKHIKRRDGGDWGFLL